MKLARMKGTRSRVNHVIAQGRSLGMSTTAARETLRWFLDLDMPRQRAAIQAAATLPAVKR